MDIDTAEPKLGIIDPAIFQHVQAQIDQDSQVREEIRTILRTLEQLGRAIQSILAKVHGIPASALKSLLTNAKPLYDQQRETIHQLDLVASKYPYYKYNGLWTRELQNAAYSVVLAGWLGAFGENDSIVEQGRLMTIEQVGAVLGIPTNVKEKDVFHLTLEEYLHAIVSLTEELSRLAVNSVTMGDYQRPLLISQFVKDIHAGFQLLNLKNDSLRRRSDSIKYNVKKIEDVVYDLSLRKFVNPADTASAAS